MYRKAAIEWAGRSNDIAGWSEGGWRYITPNNSMRITVKSDNKMVIYRDSLWQSASAIVSPDAGATIDVEARIAIDSILELLQLLRITPLAP